jgi:beta-N-acetylhexosaminidase
MSLEQKVAQLFIFGIEWTSLGEEEKTFLTTSQPGWIILMWKNISPELSDFVTQLQATQKQLPLFISVDQEWWLVKRIEEDLPSQPYVSQEAVCDVYATRARLLHALWVNINFGIVADTTQDVTSFIYPRVFQWEVHDKVADAVACTHKTLSTLKHFPGHGGTSLDTHKWQARLSLTKSIREQADLKPFVSGIQEGVDLLMMWHLLADFLDDELPATLSVKTNQFVRDLWFTGLVVTDDMWMISWDADVFDQLEKALVAGNDLLLYVDGSKKQKILDHAIQFVQEGGIGLLDVDERVRRILLKKQKIISMDDFVPLELVTP